MAIDLEAMELRHLEIDDPQKYNDLEGATFDEKLETYKRLKEDYRIANNPFIRACWELEESRQKQDINITIPIDIHLQAQSPGQVQGQAPESIPPLDTPDKVQAEIDKTLAKLILHNCIRQVRKEYWQTGNNTPKIIETLAILIGQGIITIPTLEGIYDFIKTHIKDQNGRDTKDAVDQAKSRKKKNKS